MMMDKDRGRKVSVEKLRQVFEVLGQNNLEVLAQSERRPSISQMKQYFEAKHKQEEELKAQRKRLKKRKSLQQINSLISGTLMQNAVSSNFLEIANKFGGLKGPGRLSPMPLDHDHARGDESPQGGLSPREDYPRNTFPPEKKGSRSALSASVPNRKPPPVITTTASSLAPAPAAEAPTQAPVSPTTAVLKKGDLGSTLTALKSNEPVTHIELKNSKVKNDAVIELAKSLADNETVTHLSLDANEIEASGAEALARALETNGAIMSMDLKWNPIGPQGGVALAEAIKYNKSLADINLEGVGVGHVGGIALADALRVSDTLKSLNLKENELGDEAVAAIAEALSENTCIRKINLSNNNIGYQGSLSLANCLKTNTKLVALSLNENLIYDDGAMLLADAIKLNTGLRQLHMRSCFIGDDGLCAMADALTVNKQLGHLDIRLNFFSVTSEIALQDATIAKYTTPNLNTSTPPKKQAYILWKDDDVQAEWSDADLQAIVDHYGTPKILELVLKGELLKPLIDSSTIISKLKISDEAAASTFIQRILTEAGLLRSGLEILVSLLKNETERSATDARNLPPFLKVIHQNIQRFCTLLKANGNSTSVGFARLQLIEVMRALVQLGCHPIDQQIIKAHGLELCFDMFFNYPNNNFLHEHVVNLLTTVLLAGNKDLRKELVIRGQLVRRIVSTFCEQYILAPVGRKAYFGHLVKLANCIREHWHTVAPWVTDIPKWEHFVSNELHQVNELLNTPLGGHKPDRASLKPAKPIGD